MKHLYKHFSKFAAIVSLLVVASIVIGLSATWIMIASFLVVDFASILWLTKDSNKGGGTRIRSIPIAALSVVGI